LRFLPLPVVARQQILKLRLPMSVDAVTQLCQNSQCWNLAGCQLLLRLVNGPKSPETKQPNRSAYGQRRHESDNDFDGNFHPLNHSSNANSTAWVSSVATTNQTAIDPPIEL
jgi:hypothetical protein